MIKCILDFWQTLSESTRITPAGRGVVDVFSKSLITNHGWVSATKAGSLQLLSPTPPDLSGTRPLWKHCALRPQYAPAQDRTAFNELCHGRGALGTSTDRNSPSGQTKNEVHRLPAFWVIEKEIWIKWVRAINYNLSSGLRMVRSVSSENHFSQRKGKTELTPFCSISRTHRGLLGLHKNTCTYIHMYTYAHAYIYAFTKH
jgi:hypothetical protein